MNYFLSYRHTGAEPQRLHTLQYAVKEVFDASEHTFYSTYFHQRLFREHNLSDAEILLQTVHEVDGYDCMLVLLDTEDRSEGMLIEVGYCIAINKPFIVIKNRAVQGYYFPALAQQIIEYTDIAELQRQLKTLLQTPVGV